MKKAGVDYQVIHHPKAGAIHVWRSRGTTVAASVAGVSWGLENGEVCGFADNVLPRCQRGSVMADAVRIYLSMRLARGIDGLMFGS